MMSLPVDGTSALQCTHHHQHQRHWIVACHELLHVAASEQVANQRTATTPHFVPARPSMSAAIAARSTAIRSSKLMLPVWMNAVWMTASAVDWAHTGVASKAMQAGLHMRYACSTRDNCMQVCCKPPAAISHQFAANRAPCDAASFRTSRDCNSPRTGSTPFARSCCSRSSERATATTECNMQGIQIPRPPHNIDVCYERPLQGSRRSGASHGRRSNTHTHLTVASTLIACSYINSSSRAYQHGGRQPAGARRSQRRRSLCR